MRLSVEESASGRYGNAMARSGTCCGKKTIRNMIRYTLLGWAVLVAVGSQHLARTHEKDGA